MSENDFYRLWGGNFPNCAVRIERQFKAAIRRIFPSDLGESGLHLNLDVALVPEPEGPQGTGSVSIRIGEQTIGYLPDEHALAWADPIRRVVASGLLPTTTARLFAIDTKGSGRSDFLLSVRLYLGDPVEGLPFNDPPTEPYTMLARGPQVKVNKVEEHLHDLLQVLAPSRHAIGLATLHERLPPGGKGTSLVDVSLDGVCVGQLTPQMSQRYLPIIQHFQKRGLITTGYVDVTASTVAAQVRLHAVKADKVDDQFLHGDPVTLPRLVPQMEDPQAYDLTPLAEQIQPRPLTAPAEESAEEPRATDEGSKRNHAPTTHEVRAADFMLVPASSADSPDGMKLLTQKMRDSPANDAPIELATMLQDIASRYERAISVQRAADEFGALISINCSDPEALSALFQATKDYAVAAYDITLDRLFSPSDSASVRILLGGDVAIPYATASLVDAIVRYPTWPSPDAPFVIIERVGPGNGENYIQMYSNDDGSYQLEYRDGSFERHFFFETDDAQLVSDAMWAWVVVDYRRFHNLVAWERLNLDS